MIRKTILILAALLTVIASFAQAKIEAEDLLDKVIDEMQRDNGVTASFTLRGDDRSALYMKGELKMKNRRFYLHTDDMTTWYDGKTMWTYAKAINEVNISEPTTQELMGVNPYYTLRNYKRSFGVSELPATHQGERRICLLPTDNRSSLARVVVTIATATMSPIAFELTDTNQMTTTITITDYDTRSKLSDAAFVFDAAAYPQADVVDLR